MSCGTSVCWTSPIFFDNEREASDIIDGPVGKELFGKLAAKGVIGMPISAYGFRHLHNSKRPVNKLEDINGLKLRVIQSPVYVDFVKALGANPVPMSFTEVYTAMEQKAIDGMTNTALIASSMKAYEVQKYMSLTRHMYNYIVLLVGKKTWDKFNDEEKALITQAADEAKQHQRKLLVDVTAQSLADLKKNGMVINEVAPAEIARLRAAGQPVVEKYAGELSPGLLQKDERNIEGNAQVGLYIPPIGNGNGSEGRFPGARMKRILDGYCRFLEWLIALALAVMVVLVFGNVVLRYGFNSGITVSEEVSRWLFVWLTFWGRWWRCTSAATWARTCWCRAWARQARRCAWWPGSCSCSTSPG